MNANEIVLAVDSRITLIVPNNQHMNEFLEKANRSKCLHSNWTQPPQNSDDFNAYLDRISKDNQFGAFIKLNKTNELIGVININEITMGAFRSAYLGYYIFSGFEKQGLMYEAIQQLINYAFNSMQLHRLEANVQPGNIQSLLLINKCGFIREGYSKKYLHINNQWQNHVRYAITKEIFKPNNKRINVKISQLTQKNITTFVEQINAEGLKKNLSTFEEYLAEQINGERLIWAATVNNKYVGYATLVWNPLYKPFAEKNIPEIKDLNVVDKYQRQGVGTALILTAEKAAFEKSLAVGVGFGLYKDYAKAQSLYINLGYHPDGNGITYNYKEISPGSSTIVDDDLCLWLIKNISSDASDGN